MHIPDRFRVIPITFFLCLAACRSSEKFDLIQSVDIEENLNTNTPELISKENDLFEIKEFNPTEWNLIYDLDMVGEVEVDAIGRIWIKLGHGEIALYEEDTWVIFSSDDYGFDNYPNELELAPDGSTWIIGNNTLSQYSDGQWKSVKIPSSADAEYKQIAVDPSGNVWVASSKCENGMFLYNGADWEMFQLPNECYEINQLSSAPDGTLWASFLYSGGLGKFTNGEWVVYSGEDFSLETESPYGVREIALDDAGNVYGLYSGYDLTIISIGIDDSISTIGFKPINPYINPHVIILYVDKSKSVWVNACPSNEGESCLAYYNDNKWTYFINLPFFSVFDITQKSEGSMLIASAKGLYLINLDN